MISQEDQIWIEQYLQGRLEGAELERFHARYKADIDFAVAVELQRADQSSNITVLFKKSQNTGFDAQIRVSDDLFWIEQYLRGRLEGAELERFRARCKTDRAFAEATALQLAAQSAIQMEHKKAIKKNFESPEIKQISENTIKRLQRKKTISKLFIGLLVVASGALLWRYINKAPQAPPTTSPQQKMPSSPQKALEPQTIPLQSGPDQNAQKPIEKQADFNRIFAANFKPAQNSMFSSGDVRGANAKADTNFFSLYNAGKYKEALSVFPPNMKNDNWLYFKANALLQTGSPKEAALLLEGIINRDSTLFTPRANWYLGLAYLNMKNIKQAEKYLQIYSDKAEDREKAKTEHILQKLR